MIRFFLFTAQFLTGFSQKVPLVGDARDTNNCLISAGYSWCESSTMYSSMENTL